MQTRLISIGNNYGILLPKAMIKQFNLHKTDLEVSIQSTSIILSPVLNVSPLSGWDALFKAAKKKGFNAKEDLKDFSDWEQL